MKKYMNELFVLFSVEHNLQLLSEVTLLIFKELPIDHCLSYQFRLLH